jgi:hypothetical protein
MNHLAQFVATFGALCAEDKRDFHVRFEEKPNRVTVEWHGYVDRLDGRVYSIGRTITERELQFMRDDVAWLANDCFCFMRDAWGAKERAIKARGEIK